MARAGSGDTQELRLSEGYAPTLATEPAAPGALPETLVGMLPGALGALSRDEPRAQREAPSSEPPLRRGRSHEEARVLERWLPPLWAALGFGVGAAALLPDGGATLGTRLAVGVGAAAGLSALLVLLVRRAGEHPLAWAGRAAVCGGVAAVVVGRLGERLEVAGVHGGSGRVAALMGLGFMVAAAAAWLGAWLRGRQRVLLVDWARGATRAEEVARVLGEVGDGLELLGPVAASDGAALAAFGEAGVDDVLVGRPATHDEALALSCALRDATVRIHYIALDGSGDDRDPGSSLTVGRIPTRYATYRRAATSPEAALLRRAVDLLVGGALLVLTAPVFLACAALVKLSSPGPVFFGQRRVGPRGCFRALKFRTMRQGAHLLHEQLIEAHGNMFKLRADPRTTRVGRLLRRFSLDELPQLLQVVAGHMSLIGPRPPMPEEVARYSPGELRRLGVRPGLTGLWQVSGRADLPFARCVELDAHYIERWSPRLELAIAARTVGAVLGGKGAY